jgi:hypothetical protein
MVLLTQKLSNKPVTNFEHYIGPVSSSHWCVLQFKRVKAEKFTISSAGNTCIMLAGESKFWSRTLHKKEMLSAFLALNLKSCQIPFPMHFINQSFPSANLPS